MTRPLPPRPGGVASLALLFCAAAGGAGLALDYFNAPSGPLWLATQSGGRALLGVVVAGVLAASAYAVRFVLARRKGERDADDRS